jgi:membrane-associated phospholipid phosphatase
MEEGVMKNKDIYSGVNSAVIVLQVFFLVLFLFFPARVNNSGYLAEKLILMLLLSAAAAFSIRQIKNEHYKAAAQTSFILLFFGVYYELSSSFQLIFSGWQDGKLIALDEKLFGSEVSLLMQKIVSPYLTEAMMFSYIAYLPLLVITAYAAFKKGSQKGLAEYLLLLSVVYIGCYITFLFFPVAGQMNYAGEKYSVPLNGGLFTWLGEFVRSEAHFPGGNLPSPHCAASTVMLYILFKYNRTLFYISLPVVLLLYVSTVYGRYHYIWDAVSGIVIAAFLVYAVPVIIKIRYLLPLLISGIINNPSPSGSLSEN